MVKLSNEQFDVAKKLYELTPSGDFVPIKKPVSDIPKDKIVLVYSSRGPYKHYNGRENCFFTLRLYVNGKPVEKLEDCPIEKSGRNETYEMAVKHMKEKAIQLSKLNPDKPEILN